VACDKKQSNRGETRLFGSETDSPIYPRKINMVNAATVWILVLSLFLCGCTFHINHDIEPVLARRPLVESSPLTVAVYFSPELRAYRSEKCESAFPLGTICHEYNNLGPQSVALFESVFTALFDQVLVIDSMPIASATSKVVAGILAPAITEFNVRLVETQVTYRVALYSPAGEELNVGEFDGSGPPYTSEGARVAMRDAAARFVRQFRKEPVIVRWLEDAIGTSSDTTQSQAEEVVRP
jgi:hypothetical protein